MKRMMAIAAMLAAFGLGTAAAFAASADKPPAPPGQGECMHGNSLKPCKEDPQPDHGKDCEEHGNHGGVNEDHCKGEETETTETETTETETTETETTETETTETETTETTPTTPTTTTGTTATGTTTTETTTESTPTESAAVETAVTEVEQQVFTPPTTPKVKVKSASSGPAAVADPAVPVSATKPSKAAQPAPFTP
jgi:hypothetical protein